MARELEVGEQVFVNISRLDDPPNTPGAFYNTEVVDKTQRSVKLKLPNNCISDWISAKYVHRKAGIIILQFGDYDNEMANLDPLSKGILQNARILYGDDAVVRYWKIRSRSEIRHLVARDQFRFADKIILIGHGTVEGELMLGNREMPVKKFGEILDGAPNPPEDGWDFLCAVCDSGRAVFAKTLSNFQNVRCVIGPMHKAHSSEMAQFIQSFLNWNLLAGYTTTVAAKYARHAATGIGTFRLWKNGTRRSLSYD